MAMISDVSYALHVLRLTHLRHNSAKPTSSTSSLSSSALTPSQRIISVSHTALTSNAYVQATDLGDVDLWPEIGYALDSPVLEPVGGREVGSSDEDEAGEFDLGARTQKGKQIASPNLVPSRSYARNSDIGHSSTSGSSHPVRATPNRSRSGDPSSAFPRDLAQRRQTTSPSQPNRTQNQEHQGGGGDPSVSLRYRQTIGRQSNLGMGGIRINNNSNAQDEAEQRGSFGSSLGPGSNQATPTATNSRLTFSNTAFSTPGAGGPADLARADRPTGIFRALSSRDGSHSASASTPSTLRDRSRSNTLGDLASIGAGNVGSLGSTGSAGQYGERTPTARTLSDLTPNRPHTLHLAGGAGAEPSGPFGTSSTMDPSTGAPPSSRHAIGLQAQIVNLRTRARRPRADSAPMVVVSSPGREGRDGDGFSPNMGPGGRKPLDGHAVGAAGGNLRDSTRTTSSQRRDVVGEVGEITQTAARRGASFPASSVARPASSLLRTIQPAREDPPPVIGSVRDFFGSAINARQLVRMGGAAEELAGYGTSVLGMAMLTEGLVDPGVFVDLKETASAWDEPPSAFGKAGALADSDTDGDHSDYRSLDEGEDGEPYELLGDGNRSGDNSYGAQDAGATAEGMSYMPTGGSGMVTALGSMTEILEVGSTAAGIDQISPKEARDGFAGMDFEKRALVRSAGPIRPLRKEASELSKLFRPTSAVSFASHQSSNGANPFLSQYAPVPPPQGSDIPSLSLFIFFPHSDQPSTPVKLTVRRDVTVEEVIGWACAQYCEQGRTPGLGEGHDRGENRDVDPAVWMSTAGWALRIVEDEDDGEVDDDFPALDREGQIVKFSFNAFAVVEASADQIRKNLAKQPLRPTLTPQLTGRSTRANSLGAGPSLAASTTSTHSVDRTQSGSPSAMSAYTGAGRATTFGTQNPLASGLGISTATQMAGIMVLLRIKIVSSPKDTAVTTINVPSDMYFADIIELLVRKRHLDPPVSSEWTLVLADMTLALPLDRTVESLMGNVELALVRKQWAERHKLIGVGKAGERRGGDPSTSIFKRPVELPRSAAAASNAASSYRKYIVQRKMPIGRHERILAIDGDYIHIMPTDNKTFFDSMKTSSFHITAVDSCKQNAKSPTSLKILVVRDGAMKRYDFETENAGQATEIVSAIKTLMKIYQADKVPVPAPATRRVMRGA